VELEATISIVLICCSCGAGYTRVLEDCSLWKHHGCFNHASLVTSIAVIGCILWSYTTCLQLLYHNHHIYNIVFPQCILVSKPCIARL